MAMIARRRTGLVITVGAIAVLATAEPVLAQSEQRQMPMMGRGMMGDGMMNCPMMGESMMGMLGQENPAAAVEGRLGYIKVALGITEQQTQAWKGYEDAARAAAQSLRGEHRSMMDRMQSGSAVERLDKQAETMERRLKAIQTLKPATAKLYEMLTAEQRQKADQILRME